MSLEKEELLQQAEQLIRDAQAAGMIVTIELKSLEPLAMGNYEMIPNVFPAHPY